LQASIFAEHLELPRHGYAAISLIHHASPRQNYNTHVYVLRFSVVHLLMNNLSVPESAVATAFVHPSLLAFLGHPDAATMFPIKSALSCSLDKCNAFVTR
jgi:hypothetical protein